MVQMHIETVRQPKSSIALNDLPEYVPDHIRFKLVSAYQTNAYHFTLYILSIAYPEDYQISTRNITDQVVD